MIRSLKPYPSMGPSRVEWMGHAPEHWEIQKLRYLLRPVSERKRPDLPLLSVLRERGVILRDVEDREENHNFVPDDLTNYKVVRTGQFAMNKMKAWQGSYGISRFDGLVSPAYFVFSLDGVDGDFFHRAIRSRGYIPFFAQGSDGVRIGQWDLSQERMKEIPFLVPPLAEQAAIIRYLNHVDRRINRYIRAKQRLGELLEEEKQVIIHRAVTRGLDPDVPLKPSGVDWLGDVPDHWEVRRLKTLASMSAGASITALSIEESGDYPVYGGNGIRGYTPTFTHDGDFALIGRQGALCGNVHLARGRLWASEHAVVAALSPGHDLGWFGAALAAMDLNQYSIAAAQPGLAVDRVMTLSLAVPPAWEQKHLSEHLDHETADLEVAIDRASQ